MRRRVRSLRPLRLRVPVGVDQLALREQPAESRGAIAPCGMRLRGRMLVPHRVTHTIKVASQDHAPVGGHVIMEAREEHGAAFGGCIRTENGQGLTQQGTVNAHPPACSFPMHC